MKLEKLLLICILFILIAGAIAQETGNSDTKITDAAGKKKVEFTGENGLVTDSRGYEFKGIAPPEGTLGKGEITFNEKGNVESAEFRTKQGTEQEYVFGNDRIKVPEKSQVELHDGRILVQMPDGSVVSQPPKRVPKDKEIDSENNIITYKGNNIKSKTLEGKEITFSGSLGYQWNKENQNWEQFIETNPSRWDGQEWKKSDSNNPFTLDKIQIDTVPRIGYKSDEKSYNDRVYLGFNEKPNLPKEGGSYISVSDDVLSGGSTNDKNGPLITREDNKERFAIRSLKSSNFEYNFGKINEKTLNTNGVVVVDIGNKGFSYAKQTELDPNKFFLSSFDTNILNQNSPDTNFKTPELIWTANAESNKEIIKFNSDGSYKIKDYTYNYPIEKKEIPALPPSHEEIIPVMPELAPESETNPPVNPPKPKEPIAPENPPNINQPTNPESNIPNKITAPQESTNPLYSSVRISVKLTGPNAPGSNGYGSGTIIGFDESGNGVILSCGHNFEWNKIGDPVNIDFYNGNKAKGEVIDFLEDDNNDISLIKVPKESIQGYPASPILPQEYKYNAGDDVLRIGCPEGGKFTQTPCKITDTTRHYSTGRRVLDTNTKAIQGESGGGLFNKKGLIGVLYGVPDYHTSSYSDLKMIYSYLDRLGIKYIIKIILIINFNTEQFV